MNRENRENLKPVVVDPEINGQSEHLDHAMASTRPPTAPQGRKPRQGRARRALALDVNDLLADSARTDSANARRFAILHGKEARWCGTWGKWLAWDSSRWVVDAVLRIEAKAKEVGQALWTQTAALLPNVDPATANELTAFARMTASARGIGNMLSLAKSEPGIAILPDVLDSDPWALNVLNGTLDLRTGELRPHDRADLITKLCPLEFDPAATCWTFGAMLDSIMGRNLKMVEFLQRAVGYSLTGSVREQVLFFLHGGGSNGKTTFLNALLETIGPDFSMQAPDGLLMIKRGESHPTERADLFGRRMVSSTEVEDGARLSEVMVKQLTGGDVVRARRMREDFWQFVPTHKLWVAANHKPVTGRANVAGQSGPCGATLVAENGSVSGATAFT